MFSPDLIAVDGADQRQRDSWIVDAEGGKGLGVAIEIVVRGDRKKDLEKNVERYARLGIPEYYLFDRRRVTLAAWELIGSRYQRRVAQSGRFHSAVLGLELWLDGEQRLREEEQRLREEEQRLRGEEQRLREEEQRAPRRKAVPTAYLRVYGPSNASSTTARAHAR
jgi:Uma2 family endonuclease